MVSTDWGQDGLDTDVPNVARMYDCYLGGLHNFPADREMAQRVIGANPQLPATLRCGRAFLRRVVRYLVGQGIRQFIDLGSGLPTMGNVHEIAQAQAPDAKVVYVDVDPTAVLHSRLMLVGNPGATVLHVDLREPALVLSHRDLRWLINLGEPVALLAFAVLHFIGGHDDPQAIMKAYGDQIVPGSHMVISHGSIDDAPETVGRVAQIYARSGNPMYFRTHAQIAAQFGDFQLVEPGLVKPNDWHPELADQPLEDVPSLSAYGGVARKP